MTTSGDLMSFVAPANNGAGAWTVAASQSIADIVGTAGQLVEAGERTEVVALPPNFDERRGELSIQLDHSLAAGMRDGLKYLEHYPYECTEQTLSRFLPNRTVVKGVTVEKGRSLAQ